VLIKFQLVQIDVPLMTPVLNRRLPRQNYPILPRNCRSQSDVSWRSC